MKLFFNLLLSIICISYTFANTPVKFNYLDSYKSNNVTKKYIPIEEIVLINNQIIERARFEYNLNVQLIKSTFYRDNRLEGYTVHEYTEDGISKEITYDNQKNIVEIIKYKYNEDGLVSEYNVTGLINGKKEPLISWNFSYNKDKENTGGKQIIDSKVSEFYTSSKLQIIKSGVQKRQKNLYNGDGKLRGTISSYFIRGRLTRRERKTDSGIEKIHYNYNQDGYITDIQFNQLNNDRIKTLKEHKIRYGMPSKSAASL